MASIVVQRRADGNPRATRFASLARRLRFAGASWYFFDRLFCNRLMRRFARIGYSQTARLPDHALRIGFDLLDSLRGRARVPEIGSPELALLEADGALPQHPRYLAYWSDAARHASVGMIVGIDLIRHGGRYYVLEVNHGPSLYARRRAMYDTRFDPIVTRVLDAAKENGFTRVVPIAFGWPQVYVDDFERAGREYGIEVVPTNCPIERPGAARMVALPRPLDRGTMYAIHSGLMTPLCRYVDNKWYSMQWLGSAIANELASDTKLAIPRTEESLFLPDDRGERWPNLVVKLAGSARSADVIAGRFESDSEARTALGLNERSRIPKQLRRGYVKTLLFYGRDRVIYQAFVPPELDEQGHARLVRLHLLIAPNATSYLSAHFRISRKPVPERVPRGVIRHDHAFIFNDADYALLPRDVEEEVRGVAAELGGVIERAIQRKFVTVAG